MATDGRKELGRTNDEARSEKDVEALLVGLLRALVAEQKLETKQTAPRAEQGDA